MVADNPRAFAHNVMALLQDAKKRKALSVNGKKFLKKNYSWDRIYAELDAVVKESSP